MKGVIFDMDGTLIDSMNVWKEADKKFLNSYGIEPDKEYFNKISSLTFAEGSEYIIKRYGIKKTADEVAKELTEICYKEYAFNLKLNEGVYDYILKLHKDKIKMAVATSCIRSMCEAVLKRNGIFNFFDALVFSDEVGSNKSKPDIYIKAAELIKVNPKECIVFEDAVHAAKGALSAGMTVIGVYDEYSKENEEEMRKICHKFIYSFKEMC